LPGSSDYTPEQLAEDIDNLWKLLQECCPLTKDNLCAIPLKNLKVKNKNTSDHMGSQNLGRLSQES
jgi:hypothetical protein